MKCKCGSKVDFIDCCNKFLTVVELPQTAEQLMRSRYSAFATNNLAYIENTMKEDALAQFSIDSFNGRALNVKWLKLEVIRHESQDDIATVEFKAYFRQNNKKHIHHELSQFKKIANKWYYVRQLANMK